MRRLSHSKTTKSLRATGFRRTPQFGNSELLVSRSCEGVALPRPKNKRQIAFETFGKSETLLKSSIFILSALSKIVFLLQMTSFTTPFKTRQRATASYGSLHIALRSSSGCEAAALARSQCSPGPGTLHWGTRSHSVRRETLSPKYAL